MHYGSLVLTTRELNSAADGLTINIDSLPPGSLDKKSKEQHRQHEAHCNVLITRQAHALTLVQGRFADYCGEL